VALIACAVTPTAHAQAPVDAPGSKGKGVHTLYLIRHGYYEYDANVDEETGSGLLPLGLAQARLVSARLQSLGVKFDELYSSTFTRARQTAAVIHEDFAGLPYEKTKVLCECTPTTWREDIMKELEPGEAHTCEEQLELAFSQFFVPTPDADRNDILVCHANVIRYLITRSLRVDPHAWLGMALGNCSLTVVRIAPDGAIKVLMVGDVGHIPINLQSGLYTPVRDLEIPE